MLGALCIIWGITWPMMKVALIEIPPLTMRAIAARGISQRRPNRIAWTTFACTSA